MRHSFLPVRLLPEELPAIPPAGAGFGRPFLKFHVFRRQRTVPSIDMGGRLFLALKSVPVRTS